MGMPIDINYDLRGDPTVGKHTAVPGYSARVQIEGAIMQYVQIADDCQGYDFMWATVRFVQSLSMIPMLPLISALYTLLLGHCHAFLIVDDFDRCGAAVDMFLLEDEFARLQRHELKIMVTCRISFQKPMQ
ncbi:hypothetical protein GTA08_BOTSDO12053 [Neofusicoccum parvum]|uniref:Uncharacterized protein n=1 Tax=Neofusicoccum parvum TaxID=310453 RepID=A0ACB5S9I6_9PEZI|nr:hypothetical protein GTA08_BOTSDO12053 [Neofusicoccum parvum]